MSLSPNCPDTAQWLAAEFTPGLVSVIIPTYNRAELIGETLASLRAQTWRPLEIIVVDDGSTDDTVARLAAWTEGGAGWSLGIVRQERRGVAAARNAGLRRATGEFFYYLDSDDLIFPEALSRLVVALQEARADYVYAAIDLADERGRAIAENPRGHPRPERPGAFFRTGWLVHGALYRRAVVQAVGPWHEAMFRGEDTVYSWQVRSLGFAGRHLPEVMGLYRQHPAERLSVGGATAGVTADMVGAVEVFAAWLRATGRFDEQWRRVLFWKYCWCGVGEGMFGHWAAKRRAFAAARAMVEGRRWEWRRAVLVLAGVESPRVFTGLRRLLAVARRLGWEPSAESGRG